MTFMDKSWQIVAILSIFSFFYFRREGGWGRSWTIVYNEGEGELFRRGGKADMNEFMGSIGVNYGISRKTKEEYLEDLGYAGAIDVRANTIVLLWTKRES